ncbi:MAG: hypothetical protein OES15_00695 [Nitrosopumilus sp.]|nr:hypothetical protein [Nitrosopumilus sp.]MDH3852829.1 hypothetical protein [Nitrosopumilus sp.]
MIIKQTKKRKMDVHFAIKKEFDFVIPKINLNRNDDVELRSRILNMSSDERRPLGINKSTLEYIKKNLSEGKTSKIYEKILLKI